MTPPWPLRISDNRRHLIDADGAPFFYLADTAWELFHRLSLEEAERYLQDRATNGFTVIQAVILAELDGLRDPSPLGHLPLQKDDPTRPDEGYFQEVDAIVDRAATLGLVMAILPTWGDKWNLKHGQGPVIFTPDNAFAYGQFLGRRYRDRPVIWVLGGDRPIETDEHLAITRAMADGLTEGDGGRHLKTFHPNGAHSSSQWLHDEPWLDFHMAQTGHSGDAPAYRFIEHDYHLEPTRPCLNGEPCYEDIPEGLSGKPEARYLDEHDTRRAAYWSVFSGAAGHTYGCNPIWQMYAPERHGVIRPRRTWWEALDLPGAAQMRHLRALIESRPMLTRIADQRLIAESPDGERARACRDEAGRYAMAYLPSAEPVTIHTNRLSGQRLRAWTYDPRHGTAAEIGVVTRGAAHTFQPPHADNPGDWVLVLDDADAGFPAPGVNA